MLLLSVAVKVDEAAGLYDCSLVLGHRLNVKLGLCYFSALDYVRFDAFELVLIECLSDSGYVYIVAYLEIRLTLEMERNHSPVHAVGTITLRCVFLSDVSECSENSLA